MKVNKLIKYGNVDISDSTFMSERHGSQVEVLHVRKHIKEVLTYYEM